MNKIPSKLLVFLISAQAVIGYTACSNGDTTTKKERAAAEERKPVSETRETVKKEAVQSYTEKMNDLNDSEFRVELFETPQTFAYFLKVEAGEVSGTDTIKIPNFGRLPQPIIRKDSANKLSCILGFNDNYGDFREYKRIFVNNGDISVKTLRRYSTYKYQIQNQD